MKRISKQIISTLLGAHVLVVLYFTLVSRETYDTYRINMELFPEGENKLFFVAVNLFMLCPMGILLPLLFGKNMLKRQSFCLTIACGFLFSLLIEFLQLISKRGIFELSDIIFNTLGVFIGYYGYLKWLNRRQTGG